MATLPVPAEELIARFGPSLNFPPKEGYPGRDEPDEVIKTHCCFCGMQCGIKLLVKENRIVGFEPWEEFPFNEGRLCPKGVQRYLQNNHPDRLLDPIERLDGKGFGPIGWDAAFDRAVSEIQRIQKEYGKDAFAMLSGVSLTNEKSYLVGKFARVALKTKNLDYNGRLCMVSAGAGNKKAFGLDRGSNNYSDLAHAEVVMICGTNVSETFPTLTHWIWQARDFGAKLIVVDPRLTPIARTADLHLPIRPGRDSALYGAILHQLINHDWLDHDFIANHTSGFEEARKAVASYDLEWAERTTGIAKEKILQAAKWWGPARTSFLLHARGIEHHSKGVENVLACINLVLATGRIGKPYCGYATITGQGNGQGGREHGHKCDQLPGNRDIENPEHRQYISRVWGIEEKELPGKGLTAYEIMEAIHRGEIKGLLSICFNPLVSLPNNNMIREALEKLEFYVCIDFFLNETARHANLILPGSLHEEEDGTVTTAEGRVVRIRKAVNPPGNARTDTSILLEIARRLGAERHFTYNSSEEIFNELRVASKGGTADYFGITYKKIEDNMGVFWPCPSEDHPGTPRLWEDRKFKTPDGRAHFHGVPYRDPAELTDADYPMILTTGRVVSQYLSGTQTRRIGKLVEQYPEPLLEIHPKTAAQYGIKDRELVRVSTRRGAAEFPAQLVETIREDTVFIPYHWPGRKSANQLTSGHLDPVSKIPEFKGVRMQAGGVGPTRTVCRRNQSLRQCMNTTTFRTDQEFFFDPQRCIGCHACEMACAECETNGQTAMIHVDYVDRFLTTQTSVQVCMHCEDPVCAKVCPADAITKDEFGIVHSANTARCIACSNCVQACPFGVPKKVEPLDLMMKCNMCYDRTSAGKKPMCATVCPSGALFYGTREQISQSRPNSSPVNTFRFGQQLVKTKVNIMMPKGATELIVDSE